MNGDELTRQDMLLSERVEHLHLVSYFEPSVFIWLTHSHTRTQLWRKLSWINVLWHRYNSLSQQSSVFSISTVPRYSVNGLVDTHLVESAAAGFACAIVTTMPSASDSIAFFPTLFRLWYSHDLANNFVTRNDRKAIAKSSHTNN